MQYLAHGYRLELNVYETLSNETLENLAESLDELLEANYPEEFDVSLAVCTQYKTDYSF